MSPVTRGRSRYDGLNFSYRWRLSRKFSINSSYVLSRALAYNGNAAAFRNRPFDELNYLAPADFGRTPSDSTHRGVVSGIVDLPYGIRFSTTMLVESGRPYNPNEGIDVLGYGESSLTRHAIVPKGQPTNYAAYASATATQLQACLAGGTCVPTGWDSARGAAFFQWDVRVGKQIRFRERAALELFQALDLTNHANFGPSYNNNVRTSSFGTPNAFITPGGTTVPRASSARSFGSELVKTELELKATPRASSDRGYLRADQAGPNRETHHTGGFMQAEFLQDVTAMGVGSFITDAELAGGFLCCIAARD
jgi:hypothetical protein